MARRFMDPEDYTKAELVSVVRAIQIVLWRSEDMYGKPIWDPNKEWDSDTIVEVSDKMLSFRPIKKGSA